MRHVIDKFIAQDNNSILLIADLGRFPICKTAGKCIDVGLSETLLVNVAIGLAITGKHVYVYSAANFVLYRAFEQIKLHILGNASRKSNSINITFLNGGAGFCYAGCGTGHYLLDDLTLITQCAKGMKCYFPYDEESTIKILTQTHYGINYVRLCLDDQAHKIFSSHSNSGELKVITVGWLVEHINNIKTKHHLSINVVPLVEFSDLINVQEKFVFIYDNFKLDMHIPNCISQYYIIDRYECIGMNRKQTLQKYGFDENSILEYLNTIEICDDDI